VTLGALLTLGSTPAAVAAEAGLPLETLADLTNELWEPSACPRCAAGEPLDRPATAQLVRAGSSNTHTKPGGDPPDSERPPEIRQPDGARHEADDLTAPPDAPRGGIREEQPVVGRKTQHASTREQRRDTLPE
jgi:hypothetical protein